MAPGAQTVSQIIQDLQAAVGPGRCTILHGYLGETSTGANQVQRLYRDLTREWWLELSVADIQGSYDLEEGRGSLVWMLPVEAEVREVRIAPADLYDVSRDLGAADLWGRAAWNDDDPGGPPGSTKRYGCH
jgi:hypothetical protein